ncbi:MAG: 30S ribosomal protein S20 [Candidatus Levyibacteriota bacterium]
MPVIKSAKKKLRKDKKRTQQNKELKALFKNTLIKATKKPTEENLRKTIKAIDKLAKKNIIHKNKAARLKSKLAKLSIKKTSSAKTVAVAKKKTIKKAKKATK